MQMKRIVAASVFGVLMAAGAVQAANWWVDSQGAGDGTASNVPINSIQSAINAAAPGDTINILGGTGRSYTNVLAYDVAKSNLTLQDWQDKPLIILNTNNFPGVVLTNGAFFSIRASNVVVRNVRIQVDNKKVGAGTSIFRITNAFANVVLDGCEGRMLNGFAGTVYNAGSIIDLRPGTTNCTIRNCLLADWDYGSQGWRLCAVSLQGSGHYFVGNTFSNVDRAINADGGVGNVSGCLIRSNRFLNCLTEGTTSSGQLTQLGVICATYNALLNSEISCNIAWNSNGKRPSFLQKSRSGFNGTGTRVFNNTIYNLRWFADTYDVRTNNAEYWTPLIVNNLMLQSLTTNLVSQDADIGMATNAFQTATFVGYNIWFGGTNVLADARIVRPTFTNNVNVLPALLNTNNTVSPGFLQPDANVTPGILAGFGTVSNSYPAYIGAVAPVSLRPRGTSILCR